MMAGTAESIHRYTADEYYAETEQLEQRTELLDGEIVDMASPSIRHQELSAEMLTAFRTFVKQNGGKCRPAENVSRSLRSM